MKTLGCEKIFEEQYGTKPVSEYFAPGRVNLIGEYTDIAGGNVLPMAIQLGIYACVSPRDDKKVVIYSLGDKQSFDLSNLTKQKAQWVNYVLGVFYTFNKHGYSIGQGLNIAMTSTLPTASGLSSSAALEVLIGTIIKEENNLDITKEQIVKFAKETENDFIGVASGIMDQFACECGLEGKAILLNTKTLETKYVPFELGDNDLVVMNSNKQRTLADSKYNQRVKEMNEGLRDLKEYLDIDDVCSLSVETFEKYKSKIKSEVSQRRIKHLVYENQRVLNANTILSKGDIDGFAEYLNQSHKSLRYDFEVSGKELDTLVDIAVKGGAKGARMTGAGFGGCAIFISEKSKTQGIINKVVKEYREKIGLKAECYVVRATDGARRIK